jgi:hypothetical protein
MELWWAIVYHDMFAWLNTKTGCIVSAETGEVLREVWG